MSALTERGDSGGSSGERYLAATPSPIRKDGGAPRSMNARRVHPVDFAVYVVIALCFVWFAYWAFRFCGVLA